MLVDGWIDVRSELPKNAADEWEALTETRRLVIAKYVPRRQEWIACWGGETIVSVVARITHYRALPDLPPPPRPRGPFWWHWWPDKNSTVAHAIKILCDRDVFVIGWRDPALDPQPFIDWLNETVAKLKPVGLKHRAQLKSDDPVVTNRWATGYYCQVQGRHFIILDDAEVFEYRLDEVLDGFVEIRVETLEVVE